MVEVGVVYRHGMISRGHHYRDCQLCPRRCGVDRYSTKRGFCRSGVRASMASAVLHFGEEPPIVGNGGSGAVFFTECTLRCAACQNCQLSHESMGREVSTEELAAIYLSLQAQGAVNLNLVTGTHYVPSIVESLDSARNRGLTLPVVWNSSGYERIETLAMLADYVDIWLPDIKTVDDAMARTLFGAADYPELAVEAISWMVDRGPVTLDGGTMRSGTIIRHLAIPSYFEETEAVLALYSSRWAGRSLFSLMVQYLPMPPGAADGVAPVRRISESEYHGLLHLARTYSIDEGFIQELADEETWRPDFSRNNPFPRDSAVPVWTWRTIS